MFLKDVESWLKTGQIVPFLREKRPRKKYTPKYNAASGIIAGELLSATTFDYLFAAIKSYLRVSATFLTAFKLWPC
jgi:hypothetical protein